MNDMCARGHNDWYRNPATGQRGCRICRAAAQRRWRERNRVGLPHDRMRADGVPSRVLSRLAADPWSTARQVHAELPDATYEAVRRALFRLRTAGRVQTRSVVVASTHPTTPWVEVNEWATT